MKVVNLLTFLNKAKDLYALEYAKCDSDLVDFLYLLTEDEQFTHSIDLGIVYVKKISPEQYIIVDGLRRILSLSLLLHAVCECYKKTSPKNEDAIKTIRAKYLFKDDELKLHLPYNDSELYRKIVTGERLSGHEKNKQLFILLHNFWRQIKTENLQASKIFTMLNKINITLVETDNVSKRNLYYKLNSKREIDQIALIDDFMKQNGLLEIWNNIKTSYFVDKKDIIAFLKDFFITKFNYKVFNEARLYESFVNYFDTMMQYISEDILMKKFKQTASLYHNILNIDFQNENIRKAFINIKKHSGEDTYAYILNVYEDFYENNITEETFIEILNTIDEYLKNRQLNGNDISFNELIQYLNAFITCK